MEVNQRESDEMRKIPALLLEQGEAEVEAAGFSFCRTPLMLAVLHGQIEAVRLLLSRGANFQVKDVVGQTAFGLACREGLLEIAQCLVSAGDKVRQKLPGRALGLHLAAENGHTEMVPWLLSQGLDIDAKNSRGETSLMLAGFSGHLNLLERLLEAGADPSPISRDGRTALSGVIACLRHQEIPRAEAFSGKHVSVHWSEGGVVSALMPVPEEETLPLVRRLLEAGAPADGEAGAVPLLAAAQFGHLRIAHLLVERGADPRALVGPLEMSALEMACLYRREELVEFFQALS